MAARPPDVDPVVHVSGPLYAPIGGDLHRQVGARLRRGQCAIQIDLTQVPDLDAAGVGELVRAYNLARAARGRLQVTGATRRVRTLLMRVGLGELLSPRDIRVAAGGPDGPPLRNAGAAAEAAGPAVCCA